MSQQGKEPRKTQTSRLRKPIVLLTLGALLVVAAIVVYWHPWGGAENGEVAWNLTLIGKEGEQMTLNYTQITAMPSYQGRGGFFTTAGVINGPFNVKGVTLDYLCELVGGIGPSDVVFVSASDGYSSVFDYDQAVAGNFTTYDPATMREVPHGEMKLTLIYELDGKPLSQEEGKPLRLAVVGQENLLTEGFYWVKWVNQIEIMSLT